MTTEAQINQMSANLNLLASNIAGDLTVLAQKESDIAEIEAEIETMKAAIVSDVANRRFEVNNKLQFTNDDQRKSAVIEAQEADANFQTLIIGRRTAIQTAAGKRALIEQQRKEFRAQELVLLWHANNPA